MRTNTIIQQRLDDDRTNDKKKPKTSREYPAMNIPVLLKKKHFADTSFISEAIYFLLLLFIFLL